jgi:hypothetical protein
MAIPSFQCLQRIIPTLVISMPQAQAQPRDDNIRPRTPCNHPELGACRVAASLEEALVHVGLSWAFCASIPNKTLPATPPSLPLSISRIEACQEGNEGRYRRCVRRGHPCQSSKALVPQTHILSYPRQYQFNLPVRDLEVNARIGSRSALDLSPDFLGWIVINN